MGETIIQLENVTKVYRMGRERVKALSDVSFKLEKGHIYCVYGTSGSGKSTLLNMMAGLEKPSKGKINIKGVSIEKMKENQLARFRQKHIGFVFQSYNLLPNLTALENVTLPLIFKRVPKWHRIRVAAKMLHQVGLGDRLNHKPSQMSGGQQQRVSIARAFVSKPEIVFADEPTGNLDTKTSHEVMGLITDIARERQQTLIIVSHDKTTAQYADAIITFKDGKVISFAETVEGGESIAK